MLHDSKTVKRAGPRPLLALLGELCEPWDPNDRVRLERFSAVWSGLEQPGGRSEPFQNAFCLEPFSAV